jgi:peptide/nickel transport system substrate-binding protein
MLDKLGFTRHDGEGYRLFPNGARLEFRVSVAIGSQSVDVARLLRQQFKSVGINFVVQPVERSLHYDRARTNDYEAAMDTVAGGIDPTLDMRSILTIHPLESRQSLQWVRWYESKGTAGEEPMPNMKKRLALYDKWQAVKTDREADALFREILQLAADEFDVIGTVRPAGATALRNTRLTNVPASFPSGWSFGSPGPTLPQQYFFAR